MDKPALSQISSLVMVLSDKSREDHLGIFDFEKAFTPLNQMSIKQYHYINFLIISKKWFDLKNILTQLGVPFKTPIK